MSKRDGDLLPSRSWRRTVNRQGAPVTNRHLDRRDGEVDKVAIKVEESVWLVRLGQRLRCHNYQPVSVRLPDAQSSPAAISA